MCPINDHAAACARVILDIVSGCLREEERPEVLRLFQQAVTACLRSYEAERRREQRRPPRPSVN